MAGRLSLLSGAATGVGLYWYLGGFHDINVRVGDAPFEKLQVRYKVHAEEFEEVFLHVQKEYNKVKELGADGRYMGIFYDEPKDMRSKYDKLAYLRYAIGYVVDENQEGNLEGQAKTADDGFRDGTLEGGQVLMADFPVRDGRLFQTLNRFLMSRRVYPRLRNRQKIRGVPFGGAFEYVHDGIVTAILPLDQSLNEKWILPGVAEAKPHYLKYHEAVEQHQS